MSCQAPLTYFLQKQGHRPAGSVKTMPFEDLACARSYAKHHKTNRNRNKKCQKKSFFCPPLWGEEEGREGVPRQGKG